MSKKEKKDPVQVEVKHTLYVELTEDEVQARAKSASEMAAEIAAKEAELKSYNAQKKAEIKKIKERFGATVQAANDGKEYQTVECVQVLDPRTKDTHYEYRGKVYGKRKMYEHEWKEVTQRLFKDEPPILPGVTQGKNGDELAKQAAEGEAAKPVEVVKEKKRRPTKPDPSLLVKGTPTPDNVTPIGKASNSDVADVIKDETRKGGKKDHTT